MSVSMVVIGFLFLFISISIGFWLMFMEIEEREHDAQIEELRKKWLARHTAKTSKGELNG